MPTHRDGIVNDWTYHEEGNVGGYVVLQAELVERWHPTAVLVRAEVGGEETTKLHQSTHTLKGSKIMAPE